MSSFNKFRFPILIGAGLLGAGLMFFLVRSSDNDSLAQGAIGHRDVYRDAEVKQADVATPGAAPVAMKAVLENSDFKALAKDGAFVSLLNDKGFQQMFSPAYASELNANLIQMLGSNDLRVALQDRAFQDLLANLHANQLNANSHVLLSNASESHFNAIAQRLHFENAAALSSALTRQSFVNLVSNANFQQLALNSYMLQLSRNEAFSRLAMNSQFQSAMHANLSANLTSALHQNSL